MTMQPSAFSQFLLYQSNDEDVKVNALLKDEALWLTQKGMAEFYGVDKSGISRHLKNIFSESELKEKVVTTKFATTAPRGAIAGKTQSKEAAFYNPDAITGF